VFISLGVHIYLEFRWQSWALSRIGKQYP